MYDTSPELLAMLTAGQVSGCVGIPHYPALALYPGLHDAAAVMMMVVVMMIMMMMVMTDDDDGCARW